MALPPLFIPTLCTLLGKIELRLPKPGGEATEQFEANLGLSDRVLRGTESSEGTELCESEEMLKDAKVPNERLV